MYEDDSRFPRPSHLRQLAPCSPLAHHLTCTVYSRGQDVLFWGWGSNAACVETDNGRIARRFLKKALSLAGEVEKRPEKE